MITVDGDSMILQQMPDIKNELPSLHIIHNPDAFQVQHISPMLLESSTQ
jgi:hypothetical protein